MIGLLVIVFVLALIRRQRAPLPPPEESFVNAPTAARPTLWWFADTVEPAYMKRALRAAQRTQSREFVVVPLIGRREILQSIPRADARALELPPDLWCAYVIANIAAAHGGFVMDGSSTLCVGGAPSLYARVQHAPAAMFGITHDETIVSPETAVAPGPSPMAGWALKPHHASWVAAARVWNDLVARGPQAWGAASARRAQLAVWETQKSHGAVVLRDVDSSRHENGRLRTIDDLFGRLGSIDTRNAAYISYDGAELTRRFTYNWIVKLSGAELETAEFTWAVLARK